MCRRTSYIMDNLRMKLGNDLFDKQALLYVLKILLAFLKRDMNRSALRNRDFQASPPQDPPLHETDADPNKPPLSRRGLT